MTKTLLTFACLAVGTASARAAEPGLAAFPGPIDGGVAPPPTEKVDREGGNRLARAALARIKEGAWEEAAELLQQAHDKDPRSAAIATDLGFCLAHLGRRDEAERLYRAAIELDRDRFYAYVNLAELWASDPNRWQRSDELLAFLDQALATLSADSRARAHVELRLAELLRSLGRVTDARGRLQHLTAATVPAQVRRRAAKLLDDLDGESRDRALED